MTRRCSRCNGRYVPERTPDGPEVVCVNCGHRFSAVPLVPLRIPAEELRNPNGKRGPKLGKLAL